MRGCGRVSVDSAVRLESGGDTWYKRCFFSAVIWYLFTLFLVKRGGGGGLLKWYYFKSSIMQHPPLPPLPCYYLRRDHSQNIDQFCL